MTLAKQLVKWYSPTMTDEQNIHEIFARNGRKGGQATLKRHGVSHFVKASKKAVKIRRKRAKSRLAHEGTVK